MGCGRLTRGSSLLTWENTAQSIGFRKGQLEAQVKTFISDKIPGTTPISSFYSMF